VLPVAVSVDQTEERLTHVPLPRFAAHAKLATIHFHFDYRGAVWKLPKTLSFQDKTIPSFALRLAGREQGAAEGHVAIDYAIDWRTVPVVSAADLIKGRVSPETLRGKTIVVGATSSQMGDTFFFPQGGRIAGVYLHVLGAESLAGFRASLGLLPALLLAVLLALSCYVIRSARTRFTVLGIGVFSLMMVPIGLEAFGVFIDIVPGLCLLLIVAGRLAWLYHKARSSSGAKIHPVSGLPNFAALRDLEASAERPLIVARVTNYADIVSSLPSEQERNLTQQIAGRLTLGSAGQTLYQGDGGIFVWFADDEMAVTLADHLNALHALFRSPVVLAAAQLDLNVVFGVEAGSHRSTANRLGSALVAAEEAASEGVRWKHYDAARLKKRLGACPCSASWTPPSMRATSGLRTSPNSICVLADDRR
jgi:hypothetical protein